jgi:uncharacterized protein (TIGR02246 family)
MKMRLLLAFGIVIGFVLSTLAQQKDTAGPRMAQQRDLLGDVKALAEFGELGLKLDEAYNKNDAAAVAALFTEDAVLVAPDWMSSGRKAIEQSYKETFQRSPITDFNGRRERRHLNAIDNAVWSAGQWASTRQSQTGPVFSWGYWSANYVWDGDAWKIRMLTLSERPQPVPPAETK